MEHFWRKNSLFENRPEPKTPSSPGLGAARLTTHTHNEHAEKHELKGIFDKKNQGDSTFYDQTVIHTQAVYVQKAQFYEVC